MQESLEAADTKGISCALCFPHTLCLLRQRYPFGSSFIGVKKLSSRRIFLISGFYAQPGSDMWA